MAKPQRNLEFKLGLFINLGLVLLVVGVLILGGNEKVFSRKHEYYLMLPNAAGLLSGAKVLMAGVPVGSVEGFDLGVKAHSVRVRLKITEKEAQLIRSDSVAEVMTEGLVGDRVVALSPGDPALPVIPPGHEIPFRAGPELSRVVGKGDELLKNLNQLTRDVNVLVNSISSSLAHGKLERVVIGLDRVITKIDRGSGTLSLLLNDPSLYDDAKSLLGEANENRIVRNLVRQAVKESEQKQSAGTAGTRPSSSASKNDEASSNK